MPFFRSAEMGKFEIVFPQDTFFETLIELGRVRKCHFVYTHPNYHPCDLFVNEVARCNKLLVAISNMEDCLMRHRIEPEFYYYMDEEDLLPKKGDLELFERRVGKSSELMETFDKVDIDFHLKKQSLQEEVMVLESANKCFEKTVLKNSLHIWTGEKPNDADAEGEGKLNCFIGILPTLWYLGFLRMLHRVTEGNHVTKSYPISSDRYLSPNKFKAEQKNVFIIFFYGNNLGPRIYKVIRGYHGEIHDVPANFSDRYALIAKCKKEIREADAVININRTEWQYELQNVQENIFIWKAIVKNLMHVYVQMNKFETEDTDNKHFFVSACYIPKEAVNDVRLALLAGAKTLTDQHYVAGTIPIFISAKAVPGDIIPTHFDQTKFTQAFQNIIDAYGVASYREINPAPYTIITFPFLFAIMFGDIGHGLILFIFAMVLIYKNDKYLEDSRGKFKRSEILDILFAGRYIILMMGIFSCYTGFIYNDVFSKSMVLRYSHWHVGGIVRQIFLIKKGDKRELAANNMREYNGVPYPFGMDPIWAIAGEESIVTYNSIKMKLSIMFGYFHMMLGLGICACNHVYFKSYIDLFILTIPQMIIFTCLFGYLTVLIFIKWRWYGGAYMDPYSIECSHPLLINFINMFLLRPVPEMPVECNELMFDYQNTVQEAFIYTVLICIPIIILGKPIYFHFQKARINRGASREHIKDTNIRAKRTLFYKIGHDVYSQVPQDSHKAEYNMLEVWIHSGIHGIDCVLAVISHTASYLRLWALSLAHEQLSHVLWKMVLAHGFQMEHDFVDAVVIFFCFAFWAILTVSILVVMEGLSAFLHTLRLHWVEFQSKFYFNSGIAFAPWKFDKPTMNR